MKDKIIVVSTPEKARRLSHSRIAPNTKTDKFYNSPLGVPYVPPTMTCPCCGSDDTSGSRTARISAICWKCCALFKQAPGGAVHMDECMCGRHDNGTVVKRKTEEVEPCE